MIAVAARATPDPDRRQRLLALIDEIEWLAGFGWVFGDEEGSMGRERRTYTIDGEEVGPAEWRTVGARHRPNHLDSQLSVG